jgi:Domain of unknown function (DUF4360)
MKRCAVAVALTLLAALVVGIPGAASATAGSAPPQQLGVAWTNTGSGCAKSAVDVRTAPDNSQIRVNIRDFFAQQGPGTAPTDIRRTCQITAQLFDIPPGYRYTVVAASYHGYAVLAAGATARFRSNYYFITDPAPAMADHAMSGPFQDKWDAADAMITGTSACGDMPKLILNQDVRVSSGSSSRTFTNWIGYDTDDTTFDATYDISWQQC